MSLIFLIGQLQFSDFFNIIDNAGSLDYPKMSFKTFKIHWILIVFLNLF